MTNTNTKNTCRIIQRAENNTMKKKVYKMIGLKLCYTKIYFLGCL